MAILTVSREFGSGGQEIGRAAAGQLGYAYVDEDTILADLRRDGARWEQWSRDLDEHCPTVWERYDWSFRGFAALVQLHILEHAHADNAVIMGRGGNFLLSGVPHAYRIRVEAPLDVRIERIMRRESVDKETARWLCERTDNERSCFLQIIYGRRWDEAAEYDKVYTVNSPAIDDVVEEVKAALIGLRKKYTEEARKLIEMRVLAAKVKAGIATNPRFFIPILDVFTEEGSVVLRGVTHTPKEHKQIEEAARALAGGMPVRCELHYRK